jgi:nucleoside-diphosphate-sugar epimerase
MRILVIGGTRFVGVAAVRRLVELGHTVTVFHRSQTEATLPDAVEHIHGDRERLADFRSAFAGRRPDVVLDMFPYSEADALDLMILSMGVASRVVAISSQDVYRAWGRVLRTEPGPPEPLPIAETSPLRERLYPYRGKYPVSRGDDYDKILVERVILSASGLPGTVLRLPMVYGPLDPQHRLFPYLKRMDDRRPAILLEAGLARWRWTHGYVEDIAQAIALAVTDERAARKVFNVGEPEALPVAEWVRAIGRAAGWEGEIVAVPSDQAPAHLRPAVDTVQDIVTDSTRIRRELGYAERVSAEEALCRAIAWERANPPAEIDPAQFDYAAEDAVLARLGRSPSPRVQERGGRQE